jgi:hypothetical protein
MRKTCNAEESFAIMGLLYLVAHVLACGLGFFFGHYLFDKPIFREWFADLLVLPSCFMWFFTLLIFLLLLVWYPCLSSSKSGISEPPQMAEFFLTYVFILSGFICLLPFSGFLAFWLEF